jgi:dinuclear metal center YbgI/SA1388 family protein
VSNTVPILADLIRFLEQFAPPPLAADWDNVGLLAGKRNQAVTRVVTCLTLTPDVAREAIDRQAQLVVAHHPILFKAVKRLTSDSAEGTMLLDLLAAGVAVYSPHTSYDSATAGINQQLAEALGLTKIEPMQRALQGAQSKIVCFVPQSHLAAVQEAVWAGGAGTIGEYTKCSFVLTGTGSFEGSANANPAVGTRQQLEQVAEVRLEVICPERQVPEALSHIRRVHPYEEPAIDVYPLTRLELAAGTGRMGKLPPQSDGTDSTLRDLIEIVKARLPISILPSVGELSQPIRRVGIVCGAGGDFLSTARKCGCDALLTGEARFHTALEARTAGIGLLLAGHYATERPAMERLARILAGEFPEITVWASEVERDPIQWH